MPNPCTTLYLWTIDTTQCLCRGGHLWPYHCKAHGEWQEVKNG